jgi:hypothetical protein
MRIPGIFSRIRTLILHDEYYHTVHRFWKLCVNDYFAFYQTKLDKLYRRFCMSDSSLHAKTLSLNRERQRNGVLWMPLSSL